MEMARQDEIEHLSDDFYPELFGSKNTYDDEEGESYNNEIS